MTAIKARVRVSQDHSMSGFAPEVVPAGEHDVIISVADRMPSPKFFRVEDLPSCDLPWDGGVSLRREDLYGDDGR